MTGPGIAAGRQAVGRVPLAGPQQVRDRRIRAALDEVADPVAAIHQPAALAIDLAEGRLAGDDALEARRVGPVVGPASPARCGRGVGHAVDGSPTR